MFIITKLDWISVSKYFISQITIHHEVIRHIAMISSLWQKGKKNRGSSLFAQIFFHKVVRENLKHF